jgi:hypothetical protein
MGPPPDTLQFHRTFLSDFRRMVPALSCVGEIASCGSSGITPCKESTGRNRGALALNPTEAPNEKKRRCLPASLF